jgi:hypothetical protein
MKFRWYTTAFLAILMVSSCSGGDSRLSVEDGKRLADKTRRPIAETYWQVHGAIGSSISQGVGDGRFTDCDEVKTDSMVYKAESLLTSEKGGKESSEHLADVAVKKLASIGWNLEPSSGVRRSATRNGVKVALRPTQINDWSIILQVQSKCVNLGAAADVLEEAYRTSTPDRYQNSHAASSPVPTGFPDPGN